MFYRLPNAISEPSKGENLSAQQRVMVKARVELTTQLTGSFKLSSSCGSLVGGFIFLQVNFLKNQWFHSSLALGETGFLAQPRREALVSLGFIRFSSFWPGIRLGCHFIRKGQSRQRQLRITSTSSVTALDWHTVTSLGKSSLQTPLSFGPQSLG